MTWGREENRVKEKWEIMLVGYGGQGLGLTGEVLAEAVIIDKDLNVAHTQSFGAQARGGESYSSVIISEKEIIYPIIEEADILIALSPQGYLSYEPRVKAAEGLVVYESSLPVTPRKRVKECGFSFIKATEEMKYPRGISLMALGAVTEKLKLVSADAIYNALKKHFSGDLLEVNFKSFKWGQSLARLD